MRNKKPENIRKLLKIKTSNGFFADVMNYLYNPSYNHDYPNLIKTENDTLIVVRYFKFYSGSGRYEKEVFKISKSDDKNLFNILNTVSYEVIEESNRFSLNKLISLAEAV